MNKNAKLISSVINKHAAKLRGQLPVPSLSTLTVEDEERDFIWSSEYGRYHNNGDSRVVLPRVLDTVVAAIKRDLAAAASLVKAFNEKTTKTYNVEMDAHKQKVALVDRWAYVTEIDLLLSDETELAKKLKGLPSLAELLK